MLAELAEGPFEIYTVCEGTLGCVFDPHGSIGSGNPRAHIWTRVWHVFEDEIVAHKILGHATVNDMREGRSSHFERQGNRHSDRFAKKGAAAHPDTSRAKEQFERMMQLQVDLLRWGGVQYVLMSQRSRSDCSGFL